MQNEFLLIKIKLNKYQGILDQRTFITILFVLYFVIGNYSFCRPIRRLMANRYLQSSPSIFIRLILYVSINFWNLRNDQKVSIEVVVLFLIVQQSYILNSIIVIDRRSHDLIRRDLRDVIIESYTSILIKHFARLLYSIAISF